MADLQDELRPNAALESGTGSDSLSLSVLYRAALEAIARALTSSDDRVGLRAAQVVLDHLHRLNELFTASDQQQVITIRYAEGFDDHNHPYPPSRPGESPGIVRPFQGRGLWSAVGQDRDGQDGGR